MSENNQSTPSIDTPIEEIKNIVFYNKFPETPSYRYGTWILDSDGDPIGYKDITDYVHDNNDCLFADSSTRRIFLKNSHYDSALISNTSYPEETKKYELDEVFKEPSMSDGSLSKENFNRIKGDVPEIGRNENVDDASKEDGSGNHLDSSEITSGSKETARIKTVVNKIFEYWKFAKDQNGVEICSPKSSCPSFGDNENGSEAIENEGWFKGIDKAIEWGMVYDIPGQGYLNPRLKDSLRTVMKGTIRSRYMNVISGQRIARHENDLYIYNGSYDCYKISPGTDIIETINISDSPVAFMAQNEVSKRTFSIDKSGTVEDFFNVMNKMNLTKESSALLKSWMVSIIAHSNDTIPLIIFQGQKRTGKSTSMQIIGKIIDSLEEDRLSVLPSTIDGFESALSDEWLNMFDNVSSVPKRYQNLLCVSSTGGSVTRRVLYSNKSERTSIKGPVVISSINNMSLNTDLVDRSIVINSGKILQNTVKIDISDKEFEKARGGLLKLASQVVHKMDDNFIAKYHPCTVGRMYGFYYTMHAMSEMYPDEVGNVIDSYKSAAKSAENNSVPEWIVQVCGRGLSFSGTSSQAHAYLYDEIKGEKIPSASTIRRIWNDYEFYWSKYMSSEYYRSSSKRVWQVKPLKNKSK